MHAPIFIKYFVPIFSSVALKPLGYSTKKQPQSEENATFNLVMLYWFFIIYYVKELFLSLQ